MRRTAGIALLMAGWPALLGACALPFVSHAPPGPPAKPTGAWGPHADMPSGGFGLALALLPDGRVLVAGGSSNGTAIANAEAYSPELNSWSALPSLATPRGEATATTLGDGSVLVAGGLSASNQPLATAELFLPRGTWSAMVPMSQPRSFHQALLLADGRVLLVGGTSQIGDPGQPPPVTHSIDLFDPGTRRFTPGAPAPGPVQDSMLTRLQDGRVLMVGGDDPAHGSVSSGWVYDPRVNVWTAVHAMPTPRSAGILVTLANGKVLVAGGFRFEPQPDASGSQPGGGQPPTLSKGAVLFDPIANSWSRIADPPDGIGQGFGSSLLLPDGRVLVFGVIFSAAQTVTGAFYDPATGGWSSAPPAPVRLNGGAWAVLLKSGKALVILETGSTLFDPQATPPQPVQPPVPLVASPELTPWLILTACLLLLVLAAQFARAQLVSRAGKRDS